MKLKATSTAPANVGLIKYWGRNDEKLRLPANGSISMNLSNLTTTTTVEFEKSLKEDVIKINGINNPHQNERVIKHLDRIRKLGGVNYKAKVESVNSFPTATGLSSSSSGFAALTIAGVSALGLHLTQQEQSVLARQASGSACRSIPDGFVEWNVSSISDSSYGVSLYPADYWDIADIVAVVSNNPKEISSSVGQQYVESSPFFSYRLGHIDEKIKALKESLKEKNFKFFGEIIEAEALELHAIMLTSTPSLIYWSCGTLELMKRVKVWRKEGMSVYFTINTGQDIHLFCRKSEVDNLCKKLHDIFVVRKIIVNYPSIGTRLTKEHLF